MEFHNVDDYEYYSKFQGIALFRFPKHIREGRDDSVLNSTGCEIRFQSKEKRVSIKLGALYMDARIMIVKNNIYIETLQISKNIVNCIELNSDERNTNWRIIFGKGYTIVFCGINSQAEIAKHPVVYSKTMLAYGSSITHGSGSCFITSAYIHLLAQKMGYDLFNKGISGKCFCTPEEIDFIMKKKVDLLFLELGINMIGKYSFSKFEKVMNTVANKVKSSGKKTIIVSPLLSHFDLYNNMMQTYREIMQNTFLPICNKQIVYIEGSQVLQTPGFLQDDLLHPSESGHYDLYKAFYQHMLKIPNVI